MIWVKLEASGVANRCPSNISDSGSQPGFLTEFLTTKERQDTLSGAGQSFSRALAAPRVSIGRIKRFHLAEVPSELVAPFQLSRPTIRDGDRGIITIGPLRLSVHSLSMFTNCVHY